jgi:DNA-binding beta-propeller fold protein YncE
MTAKLAAAAIAGGLMMGSAQAADILVLDAKIPLGDVAGRIDHMAVDLAHQRLFVAELGNDTIGVVDLARGKVAHRITGFKEPQGVGYVPKDDVLYVANADDGTLRRYHGAAYEPAGTLKLGSDADNIRADAKGELVYVGYGSGALAVLVAATGQKTADIRLPAHPESFQVTADASRAFVNLPDAQQIAVVDLAARRQIAKIEFYARSNFPMALDESGQRLFVVYRSPATLAVFDTVRGVAVASLRTCGDADDVFFDRRRDRLYVSCGDGVVAIVQQNGTAYREVARIPTSSGARTSLFVPELDRLYVAVRARGGAPAAIWIFRPLP